MTFRQFYRMRTGFFWFDTPSFMEYFGFPIVGKVWEPGESREEVWGNQPVRPVLTAVEQVGDTVVVDGWEVADSFGHFGLFVRFGVRFTAVAFVDGSFAAGATSFPLTFSVPSEEAEVDLLLFMDAFTSWARLATDTVTRVTFTTSEADQGALALPNDDYRIDGLSLRNEVEAGRGQTRLSFAIDFEATTGGPFPLADATVLLSVDDGTSWFEADVEIVEEGLEVEAVVPTDDDPTYVSVWVQATGADGTAYEQVVIATLRLVT